MNYGHYIIFRIENYHVEKGAKKSFGIENWMKIDCLKIVTHFFETSFANIEIIFKPLIQK